jgi:hypothetical protein
LYRMIVGFPTPFLCEALTVFRAQQLTSLATTAAYPRPEPPSFASTKTKAG